MIISNRLVRLTERECCNSIWIRCLRQAISSTWRISAVVTHSSAQHISALKNYTKLSTISRYVSRRDGRDTVAQFAAEKGFSQRSAEKRSNQRKQREPRLVENASFMYHAFRALNRHQMNAYYCFT